MRPRTALSTVPVILLLLLPLAAADPTDPGRVPMCLGEDLFMYDADSLQCALEAIPPIVGAGKQVEVSIDGPDRVMPGYDFAVSVQATNHGDTPVEITITPSIVDRSKCGFVAVQIEAGEEKSDNTYLLMPAYNGQLLRNLARSLDVGETLEGSHVFPQNYVRLTYSLRVPTDITTGRCEIVVEVIEKQLLDTILHNPLGVFSEIMPPTNFFFMGHMSGYGGPIADDVMNYEATADIRNPFSGLAGPMTAMDNVIYGALGHARVLYAGFHSFDDEPDTGDRGKFWFSSDSQKGDVIGKKYTNHGTKTPSAFYATETLETGQTYTRCMNGVYIDGGWYDSVEDKQEACFTIEVVELTHLKEVAMTMSSLDLKVNALLEDLLPGLLPQGMSVKERLELLEVVYVPVSNGLLALTSDVYVVLAEAEA